MFFDSLASAGRIAAAALIAYAVLILILRIAGKRSLSKLNAFDFVVTVAFGSTLATVILSREVPLAEGVLALAMLAALQFLVAQLSVRIPRFGRLVRSSPRLLVESGHYRHEEMKRERVTQSEVDAAIRTRGIGRIEEVAAVVLETDGSLSFIRERGEGPLSALRSVQR